MVHIHIIYDVLCHMCTSALHSIYFRTCLKEKAVLSILTVQTKTIHYLLEAVIAASSFIEHDAHNIPLKKNTLSLVYRISDFLF